MTATLSIDTDKACMICGKHGAVNGGMCLECASDMVLVSKAERELIRQYRDIFANPDAPKCPKCDDRPSVNMGPCLTCIEAKLKGGKAISMKHLPERWPAPANVILMAKTLMDQHHPEAVPAAVAILFKAKHGETNGKIKLGSCAKQSSTNKLLHGWDYIIELAWDMWAMFDFRQREALLLHEICHIYQDVSGEEVAWKIESHNVEEFVRVIDVYGLWKPDLQAFAEAIRKAEEAGDGPRQMSMEDFARRRLELEGEGFDTAEAN